MADWGLCFPLGLIIGTNMKEIRPWLHKWKVFFIILSVAIFILALLNFRTNISFPIAQYTGPILFLLVIPTIQRKEIPFLKQFEETGKRSYGIYLTHLIVIDTILLILTKIAPAFFSLPAILIPLIFSLGLIIPIMTMKFFSKSSARKFYRYIFG
jgi:peptidoglycan/LPS O-acetylase OafA/YrhL